MDVLENRVLMIVYNTFEQDSRVLKEAKTIIQLGYIVDLYAIRNKNLEYYENIEGINVYRVFKSKEVLVKPEKTKNVSNSIYFKFLKYIVGFFYIINKKTFKIKFLSILYYYTLRKYKKTRKKFKKFKKVLFNKNKYNRYYLYFTYKKYQVYKTFYNNVSNDIEINNKKYHIIHCHDLNTLSLGKKLKRKFNSKLIYDSHEIFVERNKPYKTPNWYKILVRKYENRLLKSVDYCITVNKSLANYFHKIYNRKFSILQNIPNYIELENTTKNDLRKELNILPENKIMLYVGVISINRGIENIIKILNKTNNIDFVIMGKGNKEFLSLINELSLEYNVNNRVHIFGPVKYDEVSIYSSSADFGISCIQNSCLSYYYSLPNKIFEYIQAELPIICSDFPEFRNIVKKNKIGYLFDNDNDDSIIEAINNIVEDNNIVIEMKSRIRELKKEYNWEKEQKVLENIYINL